MRYLVVLLILLTACGGSKAQQAAPAPRIEPVVDEAPPPPPTYVIVHRNTPIRLKPDDDAPMLQYRTPQRQAAIDERRAAEAAERDEKWMEEHEEWWEREKERRQKLRKRLRKYRGERRTKVRERDLERQQERVDSHYLERLRDLRRTAERRSLDAPHRPWIPFRLAGRKDGWLRLSPVDRDSETAHCYVGNFGEVDRLEATFFVREDDLVPVTTRAVTIAPMRGTQVRLKPGVALQPIAEADSRYQVFVDGFVLDLTVPADAVGYEYRPDRPFEAPMTNMVFTPYSLARDRLLLGGGRALPFNPYRNLYVTGTLVVDSLFYITTQTPCGEFTVRANDDNIEPVGKRGAMRLSGGDETVRPPYARAGAMAHLPDGEPFARVRQSFPLGEPSQTAGGRSCYRSAVWGNSDSAVSRSLELCFEPSDLVEDD